ncbi:MAG TPA: hypothetical protein VFE05_24435 [Longimicrobiaceae bacterium]|jgi:hypothetical protein|nr:hypothetical protein [Longimicrobiaceae bacterium]
MAGELDFGELNAVGCWEWRLHAYDGHTLRLIGGGDLVYSHVAELHLAGVSYLDCPVRMMHPVFRAATETERSSVAQKVEVTRGTLILAIEAETTSSVDPLVFFIAAETAELRRGLVRYADPDRS